MKTGKGRSLTMLCADKSVYHAQTHTFTLTPEFEEWETKDTAGKEFELKNVAFGASVDGLVCVREAAGQDAALDTPDMIAQTLKGQAVDVAVRLAIEGTTPKEYTTRCVVESFEVSEQVGAKATYRASLKGYGLTPLDAPAPAALDAGPVPASAQPASAAVESASAAQPAAAAVQSADANAQPASAGAQSAAQQSAPANSKTAAK